MINPEIKIEKFFCKKGEQEITKTTFGDGTITIECPVFRSNNGLCRKLSTRAYAQIHCSKSSLKEFGFELNEKNLRSNE